LITLAPAVLAQTLPAKTIRIVVGFAPGGANDILARVIAQRFGESLGQTVIVDNRPGGTGIIASEIVAKSAPDGHTLLLGSTGAQAILPTLQPKLPYDPVKDLLPVSMVGVAGTVLAVNPKLPVHSVRELVALAKAQPGKLSFASSGNGSQQHLGGELFKLLAGVDMLHVPYKGNAPALADVVSGQVDMMFSASAPALPLAKAGKLRIIGVSRPGPLAALAGAPTIAESGVPGYEVLTWYGVFVSGGTPPPIAERLAAELRKAIHHPQSLEQFAAQGIEPETDSPAEFRRFVNDEIAKWAKVIKAAGVRAE
jgi:tripartite-type tricarboxylate transporter receptor subunit TctC